MSISRTVNRNARPMDAGILPTEDDSEHQRFLRLAAQRRDPAKLYFSGRGRAPVRTAN